MNIYTTVPFTYCIRWTAHNKWYYGVKYSDGCSPKDLWTTYFTSSKYVKEFRTAYGEPDLIEIRKIFDSKTAARKWENKFLLKTKAGKNPNSLNMANAGSFGIKIFKPKNLPGNSGPTAKINQLEARTIELLNIKKSYIKQSNKGRRWVNFKFVFFIFFLDELERSEFLAHNPDWSFGRNSQEMKSSISKKLTNVSKPVRSKEHCEKISKATRGSKKPNSGPKNYIHYNNGIDEILIHRTDEIPNGFTIGRIPGKYGNAKFGRDMNILRDMIK